MKISFVTALLVAGAVLTFCMAKRYASFNPDYTFGIISTSSSHKQSYINFYDDELKFVGHKAFSVGGLAKDAYDTKIVGNKMYTVANGTFYGSLPYVVEFDMLTGKHKYFDVKQSFNLSIEVNDEYVFVANATQDANITRCNKVTGEVKTISIPKLVVSMILFDDKLYAFGGDSYPPISKLFEIDIKSFEITKTIDLTDDYATYNRYLLRVGDDIYFTNEHRYIDDNHVLPMNTLTVYNTKDSSFRNITLQRERPTRIIRTDNELLICHDEESITAGKYITVYNLVTGKQKLVKLHNDVRQLMFYKGKLYSTDYSRLYVYDAKTFALEKEIDMHNKEYYFTPAFFILEDFN